MSAPTAICPRCLRPLEPGIAFCIECPRNPDTVVAGADPRRRLDGDGAFPSSSAVAGSWGGVILLLGLTAKTLFRLPEGTVLPAALAIIALGLPAALYIAIRTTHRRRVGLASRERAEPPAR